MIFFKNPNVFDSSSRIQWNIGLVLIQGKFPLSFLHIILQENSKSTYVMFSIRKTE